MTDLEEHTGETPENDDAVNNGVRVYKAQALFNEAQLFLNTQPGQDGRGKFRNLLKAAEKSKIPRDAYMPEGKTLTDEQLRSARQGEAVDNLSDKVKNDIALSIAKAALSHGASQPEAVNGHFEYAESLRRDDVSGDQPEVM
ncbi:MAG: hypothetical protein ACRBDL_03245 [Alphaproteobacteria bacterium]